MGERESDIHDSHVLLLQLVGLLLVESLQGPLELGELLLALGVSVAQELLVLVDVDLLAVLQLGVHGLELGVKHLVPEREEWLGEVALQAEWLVVDVVVDGVVGEEQLEWVQRQNVAAVVVDGLHGGEDEEDDLLAGGEVGDVHGDTGSQGVQQETLDRGVVQGTVGVWDIQSVVDGVELGVQSR